MSELKAIESATAVIENVHLVYLKSEADKVIAELKESVNGLILDNYLKDKETRHNKYKRCLNKAEWCDTKADWYYGIGRSLRCRVDFFIKWRDKWLKIAEKFKEEK
jgi:hypothetical protein